MKKFKILIMVLPGAGKTVLTSKLVLLINSEWLNADFYAAEILKDIKNKTK